MISCDHDASIRKQLTDAQKQADRLQKECNAAVNQYNALYYQHEALKTTHNEYVKNAQAAQQAAARTAQMGVITRQHADNQELTRLNNRVKELLAKIDELNAYIAQLENPGTRVTAL